MNMKKIVAAAVASVMAVSSMAIAASAEALMTKEGNEESAVKYEIDFSGLTDDQIKSIVKIEADVSVDTNSVSGCIGYNKLEAGWTFENMETSDDEGPVSGTWTLEIAAGDLAAIGEDGSVSPYAEVQFWWVNPHYDEDGKEGDSGVATLEAVRLLDASGNEVVAGGAADPAPETSADETEAPADTSAEGSNPSGGDGKDPANTGIEGVAVVAGLAVLATGAIVVAKKRK
ncbi:MAG: hypothetical protein HDT44_06590 [Ruminococcaceae bacterium]|nr:hypothetical protein [Oscillospiraceae bacterium]